MPSAFLRFVSTAFADAAFRAAAFAAHRLELLRLHGGTHIILAPKLHGRGGRIMWIPF